MNFVFCATKLHSQYLKLSADGRTASRDQAKAHYHNATAIIHPALPPSAIPYFEVVVSGVVSGWAGGLKMRFTTDPHDGGFDGSKDEPLQKAHKLQVGDRVGLLCDQQGRCHYILNGHRLCSIDFIAPVPRDVPLYGLVDVYANTSEIALVGGTPLEWNERTHCNFPQAFRRQAFALLGCHLSPRALYINTLPKWVLLDIIAILATQFDHFTVPDGVLEAISADHPV